MHPAALAIEELLRDVEFRTTRGPGPGGQHRNKSDTMVRVTHRPTAIHAQAGERRSLDLNRAIALQRLRVNLALERREPLADRLVPPGVYEPSALWKSRVRGNKFRVSARHADFPALLAEALDVLAHLDDDVPAAARSLGISSSQLVKFLAQEEAALAGLNRRRKERGLHAFR